jgi:hypothetical protein
MAVLMTHELNWQKYLEREALPLRERWQQSGRQS